jgi:stage V sporulation protein G
MEISEVRVKLIPNPSDRLKAFCSVTFDSDFVVRDIKIIEGSNGVFVAMPSRKLADHCPKCNSKNHLRAQFCNECGGKLGRDRTQRDDERRRKLHADIAHPINSECRQKLQETVVEAYGVEKAASSEPDYEPKPLEEDESYSPDDYNDMIGELKKDAAERRADHSRGGRRVDFDDFEDAKRDEVVDEIDDPRNEFFDDDEAEDELEDVLEDDSDAGLDDDDEIDDELDSDEDLTGFDDDDREQEAQPATLTSMQDDDPDDSAFGCGIDDPPARKQGRRDDRSSKPVEAESKPSGSARDDSSRSQSSSRSESSSRGESARTEAGTENQLHGLETSSVSQNGDDDESDDFGAGLV